LYEGDQETRHRGLRAQIQGKEAELARVREEGKARFAAAASGGGAPTAPEPVVRFSFEDAQPAGDFKVVPGKSGQGIEFGGDDAFVCKGAGQFGRATPFSFALWLKPGEHRPREIVFHRSAAAEDAAFRGYSLVLDNGQAVFSMIHFWPGNAIRVQTKELLPAGQWTHVAVTWDGSSRAAAVRIYVNGVPAPLDVVRDKLTRDFVYRDEWGDSGNAE